MADYNLQANYFNNERNQYDIRAIANPPHHTQLEMSEFWCALQSRDNIADFGAGTGRISIALAQKSISVCAVDVSQKSLDELAQLAKNLNLQGITTQLAFDETQKFSAIVGADILHHVDIKEFAPIFAKHLNQGGQIVFSEPGGWHWFWYVYLPLCHDFEVEKGIMQLNIPFLQKVFVAAGFKNIKIKSLGILPTPLNNFMPAWFAKLNMWFGNLPMLRYFGYRYIISAEI